jgi:hypothetical protein
LRLLGCLIKLRAKDTVIPITQNETNQIVARITPIFNQVLNEYDFGKYPAADYDRFKTSFAGLTNLNNDIADAMTWKWGHWGKQNYPQHHKNLIVEIQSLWPQYVGAFNKNTSEQTFQWWRGRLNRQTTYITIAYITHLIHHQEPLPIIDQHNFRAMNSLLGCVRQPMRSKKKPSNWNDIIALKNFMSSIQAALPQRTFSELDRFLMMYGRNYAAR